jgi:hypothetical protein
LNGAECRKTGRQEDISINYIISRAKLIVGFSFLEECKAMETTYNNGVLIER